MEGLTKFLGYFWIGWTGLSILDLGYQYFFTSSINYIEIIGSWAAITFLIGITGLMFLEKKEKQNRKSKLSELEERIEELEDGKK